MDRCTAPHFRNPIAIRHWMAVNEDSNMAAPWNDSPDFIENRDKHNHYLKRGELSRWDGELPQPTFVFGVHASLTSPVPPFQGFGIVKNYPGDNPGSPRVQSGTSTVPPLAQASHRDASGRYTPDTLSGSGSTVRSDDSRHYNPGREDVLRHRAIASRDRMHDEPHWQIVERNRPSHREDRRVPEVDDRHNHRLALLEEDRARARETNRARGRGTSPPRSQPINRAGDLPKRTPESPNLHNFPRGPDGHPQSPWAVRQAGNEPLDDEDDDCPPPDPDSVRNERQRLERVNAKVPRDRREAPPVWRERNGRVLGLWYFAQVQTIEQACNLCAFLEIGQQESYDMFTMIVQNLAAFPGEYRMEGETYLLQRQQELEKAWWITISGAPRLPRRVRRPNLFSIGGERDSNVAGPSRGMTHIDLTADMQVDPPPQRAYSPAPSFPLAPLLTPAGYAFGSAPAITPTPSMTVIAVKPLRTTSTLFCSDTTQGFLGSSLPNPRNEPPDSTPGEFPALSTALNTRWDAGELMNRYYRTHPGQWALGILDVLGRIGTQLGDTPCRDDVLSFHTTVALAGDGPRQYAHQYRLFSSTAMRMFSIEGFYAHILRVGGYKLDTRSMEHYPYLTDNLTPYLVAAWFAQHGIAPDSPEVRALEQFSRVRRNMTAGIENLENCEWNDEPRNAAGAMAMTIPPRSELRHAPLRPALSGLADSIHAPSMEGVVQTGRAELRPSGITIITEPVGEDLKAPTPGAPSC
ncbi:hypothetical protein DFH09DRAFT_1333031 [Mycena vulgaris]|nr:hypothetical protein DFH09DRAFT_1333031 [Mycena vulgaris]